MHPDETVRFDDTGDQFGKAAVDLDISVPFVQVERKMSQQVMEKGPDGVVGKTEIKFVYFFLGDKDGDKVILDILVVLRQQGQPSQRPRVLAIVGARAVTSPPELGLTYHWSFSLKIATGRRLDTITNCLSDKFMATPVT